MAHTNLKIMDAYLDWLRNVKRARAITVYQYEGKLRDFLDFIGPMPLGDVSASTIEAWLLRPRGGRAHGRRGSDATLSRDATIAGNLYKFARARGWVSDDPTDLVATPSVRNQNPKPVPDDIWIPLWHRDDLTDEARVVLGLGYFCGLRRSEIAQLRARQVDLATLRLVAFQRKGGGDDVLDVDQLLGVIEDGIEDRKIPDVLGHRDRFLVPLERLVRLARGETVLGWRKTPDGHPDPHQIYRRMERWGCSFTPHQLRHAFVTNLLRVGVPIHLASVLANHSNIQTTMRYAKLGGQDLREFRERRRRWENGA